MLQESDRKLTWLQKVEKIAAIHAKFLRENPEWTIRMTANETYYSLGFVSEALTVSSFIRTYPKIEEMKSMAEAMAFVRLKKTELKLREGMR